MAADPDQVQVESPMPAGEGEEGIPPGCWILTESREFIGRVFSFLPAKTLNTCSRYASLNERLAICCDNYKTGIFAL